MHFPLPAWATAQQDQATALSIRPTYWFEYGEKNLPAARSFCDILSLEKTSWTAVTENPYLKMDEG